jgi:hypothetical protein
MLLHGSPAAVDSKSIKWVIGQEKRPGLRIPDCTAASWICGTSSDPVVAQVHKGIMALMFFGMDDLDLFGVFLFAVTWLSFLLSFLVLFCFNLVQGLVVRARSSCCRWGCCSLTKIHYVCLDIAFSSEL